MAIESTFQHIQYFVIFQSVFCTNRSDILKEPFKTICNVIFLISCVLVTCATIINWFSEISLPIRAFQLFLLLELLFVTVMARFQVNTFESIERLTKLYCMGDTATEKLKREANKIALLDIVSAFLDLIGINSQPTLMFTFWVSSAAHNAEMCFYTMLVNEINERLGKLKATDPVFGSKVYRQILLIIEQINVDFELLMFIILAVSIITTTIYAVLVVLSSSVATLLVFLIWRQFKSLYCLSKMCVAIDRTETLCDDLIFELTKLLVKEAKNSPRRKVIQRWLFAAQEVKPYYSGFATIILNLTIPVQVLDISANYLLIIVQIYMAFYSNV